MLHVRDDIRTYSSSLEESSLSYMDLFLDDEPSRKRSIYESEDSSSEDEYVLISALTGNITHGNDDWLIDSGASKHMTGFKESFVRLSDMNHLTR